MECSFCSSSLHDVEDDEDDDGSAFASDSSVLVFLGADWALEAGVLQTASAEGAEDGEVVLFASATGTDEVDLHLCIGFNNAAANADPARGSHCHATLSCQTVVFLGRGKHAPTKFEMRLVNWPRERQTEHRPR